MIRKYRSARTGYVGDVSYYVSRMDTSSQQISREVLGSRHRRWTKHRSQQTLKRQILFYGFQLIAIIWAGVVLLRTVTLGWGPFASLGLAAMGALPISFLGIRIDSRRKKKEKAATASQP
jgi:hypothetical protein